MTRKLVSKKELKSVYGIPYCPAHISRLESAGTFPKRVTLGAFRVAWVAEEVEEWIELRITNRAQTNPSSGRGVWGPSQAPFAFPHTHSRHSALNRALYMDEMREAIGKWECYLLASLCSASIWMETRIAASEIVPEGHFVASSKMLPLAVAL